MTNTTSFRLGVNDRSVLLQIAKMYKSFKYNRVSALRIRHTGEIIAFICLSEFNDIDRPDEEHEAMWFITSTYDIDSITDEEKETYCDAFGIAPLLKLTDLAVLAIDYILFDNKGMVYDQKTYYWEFQ